MTLEVSKEIYYSTNLEYLNNFVQEMVGKECWEVHTSYPRVIFLNIGAKIPFFHPKMERRFEGEWTIGPDYFEWRIDSPEGLHTDWQELQENEFGLDPKLAILANTIITKFEIDPETFGARISFSNDYTLTISPPNDTDGLELREISWAVLIPPDHWELQVCADRTWSYTPNGLPVELDDEDE
jgi:hypothetical protein